MANKNNLNKGLQSKGEIAHFQKSKYLLLFILVSINIYGQNKYQYPTPEKSSVVDNYFGTLVSDPYRWLEDLNSEKTIKWLSDQDKVLSQYRNKLILENRIFNRLSLYSHVEFKPLVKKGKYYFSMQYNYLSDIPSLYYRKKINDNASEIIDPNEFKENKKEIMAIRSYEVSFDNKYLAFSLSKNGADWSCIRIKDIERNKALPDKIENVKFASICWKGNGFFYVRYDSVGTLEKSTQATDNPKIYYHSLNTKQIEDKFIYECPQNINFKNFSFNVTSDEKYLIISTHTNFESKPGRALLYAKLDSFPAMELKPFLLYPQKNTNTFSFIDNLDDKFVVLTDLNAPTKRLILYDPSQGINHWKILVKPFSNVLTNVSITKDKIICLYYLNGQYTACVFDIDGNMLKSIPFPVGCGVSGLNANKSDEESFCFINSFYFPSAVYKLDLKNLSFEPLGETRIAFNHTDYETSYVKFMSSDSVEIPMYLTYKKGVKRNKQNPTLLYGYGGFGIIMSPFFQASNIIWLENGGILAVPSIRGGGEQGTDWHNSSIGLKRFHAFNDFINAAKYLVDSGYTCKEKLAIEGGSNGGLLVGVAMTKNPELFSVAIPEMGVMDMLRYQNFTIGSFWKHEYGVSTDKLNFKNLYSYSPVHNIKQGIKYPATLIITSDNDDRVSPLHTYKFLATLQENGDSSVPYLLFVNKSAGHYGSDMLKQKLHMEALKLSFLFLNLDVKARSLW